MRRGHPLAIPIRTILPLLMGTLACAASRHTVEPYRSDLAAAARLEARAERLCADASPADVELPPTRFVTDGCSAWPDGEEYVACCVEHDLVYWCGGSAARRSEADAAFGRCVAESGSPVLGDVMRLGVRLGGHPFFPMPYRWGFGRPYRGGYPQEADGEGHPVDPHGPEEGARRVEASGETPSSSSVDDR
jgi:hypothetical protein